MKFPVLFGPYIGRSTTVEDSHRIWSICYILVTNALRLNLTYIVINCTFSLMQPSWRWMCWGRERWRRIWSDSYWKSRRYGVSSNCCHLWNVQIQESYTKPQRTGQVIASKITDTEREWFGFKGEYLETDKDFPEIKTLTLRDMSDSFLRKLVSFHICRVRNPLYVQSVFISIPYMR